MRHNGSIALVQARSPLNSLPTALLRLVLDVVPEDDALCAALVCRPFRDALAARFPLLPAGHEVRMQGIARALLNVCTRGMYTYVRASGAADRDRGRPTGGHTRPGRQALPHGHHRRGLA